ncbi:hypothetical protein I0C86_07680 [Plantactinospora sp. S1510]|uniref:P/Homo B domain-containing protein n=1 Tax=Plantactinospora alkalitolerans TaxID=2789879 RepID=A0ABS0GS32_9ACTN|nr:hypothetical protein [Plantactinospora alkalitolerans]MBF9128864.1 hypothetical protein [Plantactinospora alkalitolerans]
MLRRLIVLTLSSALAALALAGPANAVPPPVARPAADPIPLTSGVATTATIAVIGESVSYSFAGVSGQHITLDVGASSWGTGSASMRLYSPSGHQVGVFAMNASPTYGDYTLGVTGTWTVVLDPYLASTGTATFTLATDIIGGTLTPGTSTGVTISSRGQNAAYTFAGVSGQHITLDVGASSWGTGSASMRLYSPSGHQVGVFAMNASPTYGDYTLGVTGTWTVVLDPYLASTGTATFTLATDIIGGTLTPGTSTGVTISSRGQNAAYTFAGVSGQHITLDVGASSWGTGSASMRLYSPSGHQVGVFAMNAGPTYGDYTLGVTGTWTVVLDPYLASTGTATFRLLTP